MSFTLDAQRLQDLEVYLKVRKWIAPDETLISAAKPGEGNMNYTLRIRTNFRTFIIKQSRPYVEKYPQIPAPAHRAVIEGEFYELIQEHDELREKTPEISAIDPDDHIIILEDLGESSDYMHLYKEGEIIELADLEAVMSFVSTLHNAFNTHHVEATIQNTEMRKLNAEHIFHYPFMEDNGLNLDDITPGLADVATPYQSHVALKGQVERLGEIYLSDGHYLLHGDYYPGSWLKTYEGVRIIDPEFCFFGPAEFDLSVSLAHMFMAEQPQEIIDAVLSQYQRPKGFKDDLMWQLTGVEIMRRIIGLAQLPLSLSLDKKTNLLHEAEKMILN